MRLSPIRSRTGSFTRLTQRALNSPQGPPFKQILQSSSFRHVSTSLPILPLPVPPEQLEPRAPKGFISSFFERNSIAGQQDTIRRSEAMFQAATIQATDPRWFGPGRVGRDFRPRHALLTMHIWLIHKRLIADSIDKPKALRLDDELFNIFWDDTTCRIRQVGVYELAVNKHLKKVQEYSFTHLTHYDHAYTEYLDQPEKRLDELRIIVWHHIFVRNPEMEHRYDLLDRIAWYLDANYRNIIHEWPEEYYREARIKWVDLPDFSGIRDTNGKLLPDVPVNPDDVLPKPWLRNITNGGVEYYWNPETETSTYERPLVA